MVIFLLIFSVFLAIFSGFLGWKVREQHKIIDHILAQTIEGDSTAGLHPAPDLVLTLILRNPIEIAKRESRSARMLADKFPVVVRKMVYRRVMKELKEELGERGIDVDMHIEYR